MKKSMYIRGIKMASIVGYHVNTKNKCESFLKDTSQLALSYDTQYLGKGMYFWDNTANSKYWLNKRKRDNNVETYWVIKNGISLDALLDLCNANVRKRIDKLVAKDKSLSQKLNSRNVFGAQLDYLCGVIPYFDKFDVIRMQARYDYDSYRFRSMTSRYMDYSSRTIYCVKKSKAIIGKPDVCTEEVEKDG